MIAHLITNFESKGGAEGVLIRHLSTISDNEILVVSLMKFSREMTDQLPASVTVIELCSENAITMFRSAAKLRKILRIHNVTNMVCWMYHANIIGAIATLLDGKINIIWNVRHSLDDHNGEKSSTKIAIWLGRFFSWRASKVVFCALRSLDQHVAIKYCSRHKAAYIPNGFLFNRVANNAKIRQKNGKLVIGAAGRFHPSKDYPTLFRAVKILQDAGVPYTLRLAGSCMEFENRSLVSLVANIGLFSENVEYFGFQEDVTAFYSDIDVFILSSKTEGFPNVLVEAAYCGCFCIASNVGDSKTILSDVGRIFPVRDHERLSAIVFLYLTLGEIEVQNVVQKDISYMIDNFSMRKFNERLLALYK